jgi:hypothetical protein
MNNCFNCGIGGADRKVLKLGHFARFEFLLMGLIPGNRMTDKNTEYW